MAAADGWALTAGRAIAVGRVLAGATLLLAPGTVSRAWIGDLGPGAEALARSVGIRDLVMGAITLHTIDHPQVGPRWVTTCALTDLVDGAATVAARRVLPTTGAVAVPAIAAVSAGAGFAASAVLRRRAKRLALGPQAPIVIVPKDATPARPVAPDTA